MIGVSKRVGRGNHTLGFEIPLGLGICLLFLVLCAPASGGKLRVGVASNFLRPLTHLVPKFEAETGHVVSVSPASSGALYAQILNGAPFDIFLSADRERPRRLAALGHAIPSTRFTYARGRLALIINALPTPGDDCLALLTAGGLEFLAIANPIIAPYGRAARETLEAIGVWDEFQGRIVRGANVSQAYHFVATDNAEGGFVSLSQILDSPRPEQGCVWQVPQSFHAPIDQQAVLLAHGKSNAAAHAFMTYLKSAPIREEVHLLGYYVD